MSCKYLYKSGIKKNKYCKEKLLKIRGIRPGKYSKYCKKHQSVVKALETKLKNKNKNKKKKRSKKAKYISKFPYKKRNMHTIGIDTSLDLDALNLFGAFPFLPPISQIRRRISQLEEKKEEIEEEKIDPNIVQPTEIKFNVDINDLQNINGLLNIIKLYQERPITEESTINYDLEKLCRINSDLITLKDMIGIHKIKNKICDMIIYLCQKRKTLPDHLVQHEYLHTVLEGPPGCGKTTLAKILAQVYKKLGFLSNGKLVIAKRTDLIGKYCGHTALLTQSKIDEAKGGVLFIDEAYSLGNKNEDPDAFSRECIDTLNQNLSENTDFICIIAGYREELERRFFGVNPGLSRRFPWVFTIDKYNSQELEEMFVKKLEDFGLKIEENALEKRFFYKNKEHFPFFGGSIHTFVNKIKICNYKRSFGCLKKENIITKDDIEKGYKMYEDFEMANKMIENNKPPPGMYS